MLSTVPAAASGRVITNQMTRASARRPTIRRTFTTTAVLWVRVTSRTNLTDGVSCAVSRTGGAVSSERVTDSSAVVCCVGGLVYDSSRRLLLVQRAGEPGRGRWSVPGGRVEPGEDDAAALVREMAEETGLTIEPGPLVGRVRRGPFDIADYRCTVVGGTLRAGSDALAARWCGLTDLAGLPLVEGLLDTLRDWDALPA